MTSCRSVRSPGRWARVDGTARSSARPIAAVGRGREIRGDDVPEYASPRFHGPRRVLVAGGTVVDATGERRGDVLVVNDRIARGRRGDRGAAWHRRPRGVGLRRRAGAGRPPHPSARAGARGGRDGGDRGTGRRPRRLHRRGGHAQHRAAARLGRGRCATSRPGRGACAEVAVAGAITVGRAGERAGADGRDGRARGAPLHRRRRRGADGRRSCAGPSAVRAGLGVVLGRALRGRAPGRRGVDARGGLVAAGSASRASRPRPRRSWWPATSRSSGRPARRMHFLHLSTAGSVDLVRRARAEGVPVTAEVDPPPLHPDRRAARRLRPGVQGQPAAAHRGRRRRAAKGGLADGTIDAIATDHAPHAPERRTCPFDQAPPGMLGLETALAVA